MPLTSTSAAISASSSSLRHDPGIERARLEARGEIAQVLDLAPRQPAVPQRSDARAAATTTGSRRGNAAGSRAGLDRRDEAPPDGIRGLDRYLLAHDRAGECRERIVAPPQVNVRVGADQLAQHAVAPAERARRLVPVRGFQRSDHVAPRMADMLHCAAFISGDANGSQKCLVPDGMRRVARRRSIARSRPGRGRGRSQQGHPLVLSDRRERLRPRPHLGPLLGHGHRGDLRAAAHLRLPRAPVEDGADGRRSHAGGHRRRQDLHVQDPEGHPLRAGPGVQGQEARADGRRLRLHVQAVPGSEEPRAVRVPARRQDRRPGRARREGQKTGKFDYDAKVPGMEAVDRYTLRFRLKDTDYNFPYVVAHTSLGRGRARSDRSVRRRHDGAPGRHRSRTC